MRTIERALNIIEVVRNYKDGIGLLELAHRTKMNENTVRRFCSTLVARKYLYQKTKRDKYFLGFELLSLNESSNFAFVLKEQARPFIVKLCEEINETVMLTMIDGVKPFRVDYINPEDLVQAGVPVSGLYPLHCTGNGKIHLAFMDDKVIDNILEMEALIAFTERTVTDKNRLKEEIKVIRREGIAYDDEEYMKGLRSAAAPIRCNNGTVIAAISFVSLSIRVSSLKMKQLATNVRSYAEKISQSIGYKNNQ